MSARGKIGNVDQGEDWKCWPGGKIGNVDQVV